MEALGPRVAEALGVRNRKDPFDRLYRHRSRFRPRWDPSRWLHELPRRTGVTGLVSAVALLLIGASAVIIDTRAENRQEAALAAYIAREGTDPLPFLTRAARAHRLLFLSDVEDAAEPKRLAARTIAAVAKDAGLDAVVLEVPADEQPFIDKYLNSNPEDASLLFARPRAVHDQDAASREYLEIYRTVWELNQELGPGRSIRIIAADLPTWPPQRALAPRDAALAYARRDQHMADHIEQTLLGPYPRSRTLLFVNGYHALKSGQGELQVGGSKTIPVSWLAARLAEDHATEVYSVLVEGSARSGDVGPVTSYTNTRVFDIIRKSSREVRAPVVVPVDEHFDFLRRGVVANSGPGLELDMLPHEYRMRDVADAYVFVGAH
jgi:hypothetical protein